MKVAIRVFGSTTCEKCKAITTGLQSAGRPFQFIDALADETQTFCDEHNVDDLPHVQFLDTNGGVLGEVVGPVSAQAILGMAAEYEAWPHP